MYRGVMEWSMSSGRTVLTTAALLCLLSQVSAALLSTSESANLRSSVSTLERALQQAGSGLFDDVEPCEPLLAILGDAFDSSEEYGQFLEAPTEELLLACVEQSALGISTGEEFVAAYADAFPGVKVMQIQSDEPVVVPSANSILAPGSVIVLDCQDTWVDVRELPALDAIEAVTVFTRCKFLEDDLIEAAGLQTWTFSTTVARPCTGDDEFTEENPEVIEEAVLVIEQFVLQNFNGINFCFTDDTLDDIFGQGGSGAGSGMFGDIDPCEPLLAILGDTFDSSEEYGQFLEAPTEELLLACVEQSALGISTGEQFVAAYTDPLPGVKVMQIQSDEPVVVPFADSILAPGSVIVLDCQDTWVDVRALPALDAIEAVTVYTRCKFLEDDLIEAAGIQTWTFSTTVARPCMGDDEFTEENPEVIEEAVLVIEPFVLQNFNGINFCFTDATLDDIFGGSSPPGVYGDGALGVYAE